MKLVPLSQGQFAMVDDSDFERVNKFKWRLLRNGKNEYAQTYRSIGGVKKWMYLHQLVMRFPVSDVDHIDGNGLNNTKSNLRLCSNVQNQANASKRVDNTSGFKGVSWHTQRGRWCAKIKNKHVGVFNSPIEAAIAYDKAAMEIFGEFARTNQSMGLLCR